MKSKRILQLVACACMMATATQVKAAGEDSVAFNPHWDLRLQGGAAYTLGETKFKDLISPAVAIYGAYRFTPVWGLRAGLSGYESKGAMMKSVYKYNYLQGNVDVVVDLGNAFKYNPKRLFNPYVFLGIGVNGAFNNDDAVALNDAGNRLEYLWRDNKISPVGRGGIGLDIRLCKRVYFNLEVNANVLSDKYNSKKADNPDWVFNAMGGLSIRLGKMEKTVKKAEPAPVQPAVVPEKKPEPKPAVEQPKPQPQKPKPQVVEKVEENVFFKINSSVVAQGEKSKIQRLADYLKAHPQAKVSICGYADKDTGTPQFNKVLSRKRSEAVAAALKALGIPESRISVDYKGDTVQPFNTAEKNRVTVCIAE